MFNVSDLIRLDVEYFRQHACFGADTLSEEILLQDRRLHSCSLRPLVHITGWKWYFNSRLDKTTTWINNYKCLLVLRSRSRSISTYMYKCRSNYHIHHKELAKFYSAHWKKSKNQWCDLLALAKAWLMLGLQRIELDWIHNGNKIPVLRERRRVMMIKGCCTIPIQCKWRWVPQLVTRAFRW